MTDATPSPAAQRPLVLACGALASELRVVLAAGGLGEHVEVRYLPANLHNHPDQIVPRLRELIDQAGEGEPGRVDRPILIGYADCGTGGLLDAFLAEVPSARRLPGAHCYELFAGSALFAALHDAEPGTFYLTDFLARHFDALVWSGLGLDRHPELLATYFGNYRRVVLLSQSDDAAVVDAASAAAMRLGLHFEHRHVGVDRLADAVGVALRSAA